MTRRRKQRYDPIRNRRACRRYKLKRKYGVTPEQVEQMKQDQGHQCACCGDPLTYGSGGLAVDHDHVTSKIRALLCRGCNTGLGSFKDDPARLQAAIHYLYKHKG